MSRPTAVAMLGLLCALGAPSAHAADVSLDGAGALVVTAAPGESNALSVTQQPVFAGFDLVVSDSGAPLNAGSGCSHDLLAPLVRCPGGAVGRIVVLAGDLDDSVSAPTTLPAELYGGPGTDALEGGSGSDALLGEDGDDELGGEAGDDRLDGGRGSDEADAGAGADAIVMRDRRADTVACGSGQDFVRAEVLDALDVACERVDYGPPGRVGRLRAIRGGGRFVPVPGQGATRVDRRILRNVLYLIRRYRIRLGDGFAMKGHARFGEHPLGLAVDIYPGAGGSWNRVDRLARWAEPRQNRTRPPFRWVGYDGDWNHGRGHHLHLSWAHSPGRPGRPVRTVWVWASGGAIPAAVAASSLPRATGAPDF